MMSYKFDIGEKVIVSADATGDGVEHEGYVVSIENFLVRTIYLINYFEPAKSGVTGILVSNPALIRRLECFR